MLTLAGEGAPRSYRFVDFDSQQQNMKNFAERNQIQNRRVQKMPEVIVVSDSPSPEAAYQHRSDQQSQKQTHPYEKLYSPRRSQHQDCQQELSSTSEVTRFRVKKAPGVRAPAEEMIVDGCRGPAEWGDLGTEEKVAFRVSEPVSAHVGMRTCGGYGI